MQREQENDQWKNSEHVLIRVKQLENLSETHRIQIWMLGPTVHLPFGDFCVVQKIVQISEDEDPELRLIFWWPQ